MAIRAVDVVILAVLLFGAWRGFRNGLSGEIVRVAGLVVAFLVGARTHVAAGDWIVQTTRLSTAAARALGFGAVFTGIWALGHLARIVLHKIMTITFVKPLEIIGGVVAGVVKTAAAVSAVLILVNLAPRLTFLADAVNERSAICAFLAERAPALYSGLLERYPALGGEPEGGAAPGTEAPVEAVPAEPEEEGSPPAPQPQWEPLVFEQVDGGGGTNSSADAPESPR